MCTGLAPAASRHVPIFFRICSVCTTMSPLPTRVLEASTAVCAPMYTVFTGPLATTTWVKAGFLGRPTGLRYCTEPRAGGGFRPGVLREVLAIFFSFLTI